MMEPFNETRWKSSVTNGRIPRGLLREIPGAGIDRDTGLPHIMEPHASINAQAMQAAARKDGVNLPFVYTYRPLDVQVVKYRNYLGPDGLRGTADDGNLAAYPGTSNHGFALSIDIDSTDVNVQWMRNNARRFGFVNDVSSERWHWTYVGGGIGEQWLKEWEDEMSFAEWEEGYRLRMQGEQMPVQEGPKRRGWRAADWAAKNPPAGSGGGGTPTPGPAPHTHQVPRGTTGPDEPL